MTLGFSASSGPPQGLFQLLQALRVVLPDVFGLNAPPLVASGPRVPVLVRQSQIEPEGNGSDGGDDVEDGHARAQSGRFRGSGSFLDVPSRADW